MPALARGQENTTAIINWFITVNGILTDAYEVGYRIFDITGGLPGAQIFPTTPGDYEEVGTGAGHFSVGSYYAYDNGNTQGWTPSLTESIGTHRIEWRWKISAGAPFQASFEDFEVLVESGGSSADTYISITDVRNEGLTDVVAYPDNKVLAAIETWQAFIDRACRQWFVPKALILQVDGTDSDAIHFGVPIIAIDYIKINDSDTELDPSLYKVYSAVRYPNDRQNPRIKLVSTDEVGIYVQPLTYGDLIFRKGRKNQEIKGTFGYVEEDGSVPKLIKRAHLKLVIEKLTNPIYVADPASMPVSPPPLVGPLLEEVTDGHKIKYAQAGGKLRERAPGLSGITNDQEILDIVKLYRAPLGVATPAHLSIR